MTSMNLSNKTAFGLVTRLSIFLILLLPLVATAQDGISDEDIQQLDIIEMSIEGRIEAIANLQARLVGVEGVLSEVLSLRLESEWLNLLREGNQFAELVLAQDQEDAIFPQLQSRAVAILADHASITATVLAELDNHAIYPDPASSAADQAQTSNKLFNVQEKIDEIIGLMLETYAVQSLLGIDISASEEAVMLLLSERAINTSVYLDISVAEADGVSAALAALPADVELIAKHAVITERILGSTAILELVVERLEVLDVDTTQFREQLVTTSGKITPQLFNVGVIGGLLTSWGEVLIETVSTEGPTFLFQVFVFLLILYGFIKLSQLVERLTEHALNRSSVKLSRLLHSMIVATSSNLVLALGVLIALSQLGISLGPLLAGLGIAGFVIGFALQDTLSNFASGMMILFYKPFDVDDLVDLGGVFGTVDQMSLVNTTILTLDNQRITLPNSMIWGGVIKNVTAQRTRRVDLVFGIGYGDDIEKTEEILNKIVDDHKLILNSPEPLVRLHELGESSVNFVVRAWTKTSDYWDVYWDLLRSVKMTFDEEGISIPFPQQDVHLIKQDDSAN